MTVAPIGRRQAGALTILWVLDPAPVKGFVLGEVLEPGGNGTHMRRALRTLIDRGLVVAPDLSTRTGDLRHRSYRITDVGIHSLRRYALRRGALTVEVIG